MRRRQNALWLRWVVAWILVSSAGCVGTPIAVHRPEPPFHFEYSPEVSINYETLGAGPVPVIFLHGFGASLNSWDDIRPLLPTLGYTYYFLDLKGFGLSSKPKDGRYSMHDQAAIVKSFAETLGLERPIVVGHSYGGGVALILATGTKGPEESLAMRKMVLLDAPAYAQPLPFSVQAFRDPLVRCIAFNLMSAHSRAEYSLKDAYRREGAVTEERIRRYGQFLDAPGAHDSYIQVAQEILPDDLDSIIRRYPSVAVPTLLIWGKNDPTIPLDVGLRLQRELPAARLVVLDDCGHVPQDEWPERTAKLLGDFFEERRPPRNDARAES